MKTLLTPGRHNPKTAKGERPYAAAILHLMPAKLAGFGSVCPWSTAGCRSSCLNTSGRSSVSGPLTLENLLLYGGHRARFERTRLFFEERDAFLAKLHRELYSLERYAANRNLLPVVRLNGTSDIAWEHWGIPQLHSRVTFYDYTKSLARAVAASDGSLTWPGNYKLVYSYSERDEDEKIRALLQGGANVAAVFETLPKTAWGAPVVDATLHDWRFEDPPGVVAGLTPKGARAKSDASGFVIRNA